MPIRPCTDKDFDVIFEIINDAARAYQGHIPSDRWKEPYMSRQELSHEISAGVRFWACEEDGVVLGVMGIQDVRDVTLIRHAYVRTALRNKGVGSKLLAFLMAQTDRPVLIGTWKDAAWAVRFYEKHGFRYVPEEEKNMLLRTYWNIPARQIETSVVLRQTTARR